METLWMSVLFFSSIASAAELDSFQGMKDQAEIIESQAAIACAPQAQGTNSISYRTAERITSSDGVANRLMKQVQAYADQVNRDLEQADEKIQTPIWQNQVDAAKLDLEKKLERLNGRSPASSFEKSEALRDQVKAAYSRYHTLRARGPQATVESQAQVKALREAKLKQLQTLSQLGNRLAASIEKAGQCQCKVDGDVRCKDMDTLKAETERNQAVMAAKKAKAEATYETFVGKGATSASAGSDLAR